MYALRTFVHFAIMARLAISAPSGSHHCVQQRALSGEYVDGEVSLSADPLTPFDSPMITVFNSTVNENWSFDAASEDGQSSAVIYLTRGTINGNIAMQRGLISVAWANGTRYMENVFVDVSTLTICPGVTSGTWTNNTSGTNWDFCASTDLGKAIVTIESPSITGTFSLKSLGVPIYPGGLEYPDARAKVNFAPEMYWQEQSPVAKAEIHLDVQGTSFDLIGFGGRDKNWIARPWAEISLNWDMARAVVGPYGLMLWNYTSAVDGRAYFSATLLKDGQVIFRTTNEELSSSDTYGTFKLTFTGPVHLSSDPHTTPTMPESRHTGYLIDLVSRETQKHWRFALEFSHTTFWFPASGTVNVGQFAGTVSGGRVNGKQFTGIASGSLQEIVS